jgi:hypothetical protein
MKAILRNCSRGVQQLRMKKRKEQINQAMFGAMCQFGTTSNERKRPVDVFYSSHKMQHEKHVLE